MVRVRWAGVVLAGVAVAGLMGCSSEVTVAPTASAASESPVSVLPAPVVSPTKPPEWADNGAAGANAAALWFVRDLYPYVLATNDIADWLALSQTECVWCATTVTQSEWNLSNGLSIQGLDVSAVPTAVQELDPLAYAVSLDFTQSEAARLRSDGTVHDQVAGSNGQLLVVVLREGHDWHLAEGQSFADGAQIVLPTPSPAWS
jgi:hypothetical protein